MWTDGGQQPGADPGHPVEPGQAPERTPGLAIRHDPLGQSETYPGQPGQLLSAGPVGVDPLARAQWPGARQNAVPVRSRGSWRKRGQELHLSRRSARAPEPPANALTQEPEREKQDERAALGG